MVLDVIYQICDYKRTVLTKNPDLLKEVINTLCALVKSSKSSLQDEE